MLSEKIELQHDDKDCASGDTQSDTHTTVEGLINDQSKQDYVENDTTNKTASKQNTPLDIFRHWILLRYSLVLWFAW